MLIFDIGSNVGSWTRANLPSASSIVAVEASPSTYQQLTNNVSAWSPEDQQKVVCLNYAVSDSTNNTVTFYECPISVLSSLNKDWLTHESSRFFNWGCKEITVPSITLDELIKRYGVPEILKIDVEGAEYQVLKSLTGNQTVPPLVAFEWAAEWRENNVKCVEYLSSLGYSRFHIQQLDEYTFRPQAYELSAADAISRLIAAKDKVDWGMVWAARD